MISYLNYDVLGDCAVDLLELVNATSFYTVTNY